MKTLTRVTMEWSDGTAQELVREEADKWLTECNNAIGFLFARNPHQQVLSEHPWKPIESKPKGNPADDPKEWSDPSWS